MPWIDASGTNIIICGNIIPLPYNATLEEFSHYSDVIMDATASQITSVSIVAQPFVQVQIKESIKACRHWPLWGQSTSDRRIPLTKGQWHGKCFHLTSPCIGFVRLSPHVSNYRRTLMTLVSMVILIIWTSWLLLSNCYTGSKSFGDWWLVIKIPHMTE